MSTPVEMYDSVGIKAWTVEYDIYESGALKKGLVDLFSELARLL
ncbi:hypothetical protein [Aquimarina sp. MMG016]|nr:hypothetical protein [Aquimarina sp. MMG016]